MRVPEDFPRYLSAHEDCTEKLLCQAEDFSAQDLEISIDPQAAELRKMVYGVVAEVHRMKGFVRLSSLGPHILYGRLKPRHRIGEHISDHFARKNPQTIIVLGNSTESWVSLYQGGVFQRLHCGGLNETLERLKSDLGGIDDSSEGDIEAAWKIYYDSQNCQERRNMGAFHRHMPERDLGSAGLTTERNKNGVTLEDFFGSR